MQHRALHDWLMIGVIFLSLIFLFSFMQQRTVVGQVVGATISNQCTSLTEHSVVFPLISSRVDLCANQTHLVEYFEIHTKTSLIDCHGSTIQGNRGAMFVARTPNPTVTLRNCHLEGFEGLYQNQNPVTVKIE